MTTLALLLIGAALPLLALGCLAGSPGDAVRYGRHDRGRNALWLQHAWLGDDAWFARTGKPVEVFRGRRPLLQLAERLRRERISDVFPHLCPCDASGRLPSADPRQLERFLDALQGLRVMPWIGGVRGRQAFPDDPAWRRAFTRSAAELLDRHPRLAGVHLDVEPCRSGDAGLLALLDELRAALPGGKVLSVAGPPPPLWPVFREGHWSGTYWRQVLSRVDQAAPMLYDTGLRRPWLYRRAVAAWTRQLLGWAGPATVLLGLPAYREGAPGRHDPAVERLGEAIDAVHAGLPVSGPLPESYQGAALFCEWEMGEADWVVWRERFRRP